jgi:glycosyltransferase involved in cell wall biosynthesis
MARLTSMATHGSRLRILIVSLYFPPYNTVGAIRVGKFARHLTEMGHIVHVVAARSPALEQRDASLPVEIPATQVHYTSWWDINALPRAVVARGRRSSLKTVAPTPEALPAALRSLARLYLSLTNIPDAFWGWASHALHAGRGVARANELDAIVASAPPFTALQVAHKLSAEFSIPWFADLRDLWADKEPYPFVVWRRVLDRWQQRRTLISAAGVVTVSEPLAESLRMDGTPCPVTVVYNGFDPDDVPARIQPSADGPVRLLYTGSLYGDPDPLFRALALLPNGKSDVRLEFLLRGDASALISRARACGVVDSIQVFDPVSYQECLSRQARADALLLIQGEGPRWRGIVSGKIFEYLATGRPILALTGNDSVVHRILTDSGAGCASREPHDIARWLDQKVREKRTGGIPHVESSRIAEFTRPVQTRLLEKFLRERLADTSARQR